jgi:hypothetical protein
MMILRGPARGNFLAAWWSCGAQQEEICFLYEDLGGPRKKKFSFCMRILRGPGRGKFLSAWGSCGAQEEKCCIPVNQTVGQLEKKTRMLW